MSVADDTQRYEALHDAYTTIHPPYGRDPKMLYHKNRSNQSGTTQSMSSEDSTPHPDTFENMQIVCSQDEPNKVEAINITLEINRIPMNPSDPMHDEQQRLLIAHIAQLLAPVQQAIVRCQACTHIYKS